MGGCRRSPLPHSAFPRPVRRLAVLGLALWLALGPEAAAASTAPVYTGDFPDPSVLAANGTYFAYATQTGATNVQVMSSPDLVTWTHLGDALPDLPVWAGWGWTWAPTAVRRDDRYVLYYTVRHAVLGRQCISVAVASAPQGPFVDRSLVPLVCQVERGGSIDPSPFVDADGSLYLLWKSDDNALGNPTSLWGQRLTHDGLALVGAPTHLLRQDRAWESPVVEAPSMVRIDGTYYLFYGANWWESASAAIGYATCRSPLGRCTKVTKTGPWLASRGDAVGPGGPALFADGAGGVRMAYHAWPPGRVGYATGGVRQLWIDRVTFVAGQPVLEP